MFGFLKQSGLHEWERAQLRYATKALAGAEEQAGYWRESHAGLHMTAQHAQQELRESRILYQQTLDRLYIELEQARMLAKTAMDSLTAATTQIITLSERMADLQRLGFRPPAPESPAAKPGEAMASARISVDDVDRELATQYEELRAVDDFG